MPKRRIVLIIMLVVTTLSYLILPAQTPNMLENGGFEDNETSWSGWGSSIVLINTDFKSGAHCARFSGHATLEQSPLTVVPGKTYKLSAWIKINDMSGNDWGGIRFSAVEYNWSAFHSSDFFTTLNRPSGQWFNEIISFTPLTNSIRIQAEFFSGPGWTPDFSFDDLVLFEEIPFNSPPFISSLLIDTVSGNVPFAVSGQIAASDPDGAIENYIVDMGDGAVYAGFPTFNHTYRIPGNHLLKVTVTDDAGATDTITRLITATGTNNHSISIAFPVPGNGNQYNTTSANTTIKASRHNGIGDVFWFNNRTMQSGFVPVVSDTFEISGLSLETGVNTIQVQSSKGDGTYILDELNVNYVPVNYSGPTISSITISKALVKQYERTDVNFSLQTIADNLFFPFDSLLPNNLNTGTGVSVDMEFTNGSTIKRQPAFLCRNYSRITDHLLPDGNNVWNVRMAFRETGTWTSRIIARDAAGETTVTGPVITVVPDSLNKGYIKVSSDDNRYFEYDNGKPFVAMGHGTSVSGPDQSDEEISKWKNNQVNFGRFWLSSVSPFSDSWSSWATHHPMTNNGYMPPPLLTLNQKYRNGDFSYRIASPAIDNVNTPAIFRGFWDGKTFVEPQKQYRIIARVKTINVEGNGGLVIKTGGWLGTTVTNAGVGEVLSPYMKGDNPWSYLVGTIQTGDSQTSLDNLYLVLEDCSGEAFLDQLTIQEINPDGSLKENILSKWNANSHYYHDPIKLKEADYLIDAANTSDIHYKIVIQEKNDYISNHIDQAGFVTTNQGDFNQPANTKLHRLYEYYWRNLVARWGYATSVHSWELVNEGAPGSYPELTDNLADHFHSQSPYSRMVSTSFWSNWEPEYWAASKADYADIHAYIMTTGWIDTITIDGNIFNRENLRDDAAAAVYAYSVTTGADPLRNKPVVLGETDLDMSGNQASDTLLSQDTAGVWLHNFNWGQINHGGMSALIWGTQNIRNLDLYHRYKGFSAFMKNIPLTTGQYHKINTVSSNPSLRVWGQSQASGNAAHFWIQNKNHAWKNVVLNGNPAPQSGVITLSDLTPGNFILERWNSWNEDSIPHTIDSLIVNESGTLQIEVDTLVVDIAFKLYNNNSAPIAKTYDWPQFQRDASRTGRTDLALPPPYRVRWIWTGATSTLHNQESEPGWTDDLTSRAGYSFPIPTAVNHTIAEGVQPIVKGKRLYFSTMDGDAYALDMDDGSTLWNAPLTGGSIVSAGVVDDVAVFAGITGNVMAFDTATGALKWMYNTKGAITTAPCIISNSIVIANHKGKVVCFASSGTILWEQQLPAPVTGGIAAFGNSVYVPAEDMKVYALNIASGEIWATGQAKGQSFRLCHPVVFNGRVWVTSCPVPIVGSEYILDDLMESSSTLEEEQANMRRWLQGDDNNGSWAYASSDWQNVFAFDLVTLEQAFLIPTGPADGCGFPAPSVVVDNSNRVLRWWKTRFPTLTTQSPAFGTNYTLDISGINQQTGNRIPIDNGQLSGMWPLETDNLYSLSVGGNYLWLRQNYRGTQVIDLSTSQYTLVQTPFRYNDGGNFTSSQICYLDQNPHSHYLGTPVILSQQPTSARSSPAIAGNYIFIAEDFGIVAIESY